MTSLLLVAALAASPACGRDAAALAREHLAAPSRATLDCLADRLPPAAPVELFADRAAAAAAGWRGLPDGGGPGPVARGGTAGAPLVTEGAVVVLAGGPRTLLGVRRAEVRVPGTPSLLLVEVAEPGPVGLVTTLVVRAGARRPELLAALPIAVGRPERGCRIVRELSVTPHALVVDRGVEVAPAGCAADVAAPGSVPFAALLGPALRQGVPFGELPAPVRALAEARLPGPPGPALGADLDGDGAPEWIVRSGAAALVVAAPPGAPPRLEGALHGYSIVIEPELAHGWRVLTVGTGYGPEGTVDRRHERRPGGYVEVPAPGPR